MEKAIKIAQMQKMPKNISTKKIATKQHKGSLQNKFSGKVGNLAQPASPQSDQDLPMQKIFKNTKLVGKHSI